MDLDPHAGVQVGMRVVRGMDWKWGQQDGGEGGVGTVVELGRHGSPSTPDRTVVVQWDQGTRTNYRAGYQGAHDLLLYDNAQIGIRHPNIICDCCKKHGLRGMRWKCRVCFDYDLCTQCYMHNKHDLTHAFERYETSHSRPVTLSPRQGLPRIPLRGIFQGAKVVRGPDWEWGSQDGEWWLERDGGKASHSSASRHTLSLSVCMLSSQEGKARQVVWWTSVAGMWRQAEVWPV